MRQNRIAEAFELARELSEQLGEEADRRDRERSFPYPELDSLRASGLLGAVIPVERGGFGVSNVDITRIVGLLAEGDPNVAQMFVVHSWIVDAINRVAPESFSLPFY